MQLFVRSKNMTNKEIEMQTKQQSALSWFLSHGAMEGYKQTQREDK